MCNLRRAEKMPWERRPGRARSPGWQMALTAAQGFWEQCRPALKQEGAVGAAGSPVPVWRGWDSQWHPAHAVSHCGWVPYRGISRITRCLCALSWPHPGPVLCLEAYRHVLWCNWWALEVGIVSYCTISEHGLDPCVVVCLEELAVCQAQVSCASAPAVGRTSRDMCYKYTLTFRATYQKQLRKKKI